MQEQIDALGLTEDFILYGAVNNPYPFMKQADIYVHASRFEGKSIAIQEAQILGKPMVVSDCSGNREQVCHGRDGLMCGLTPDSLAENIMLLLEDEALRGKLGAAAAKKMRTRRGDTKITFHAERMIFDMKKELLIIIPAYNEEKP